MEKIKITEEMNLHEKWFKEAKIQTLETLPEFLRHLTEDYEHDYGTIAHAVGAAGLAAMWAVDKSPTGGITGFQAGFSMWDVIRSWSYPRNKCGLKIIDYDDLLYPQDCEKYTNISKHIMETLQTEARNKIDGHNRELVEYKERYAKWEQDMEQFKKEIVEWNKDHPEYPTYEEDPSIYEHIGFGTTKAWEEYENKKAAGFKFVPLRPYVPSVHPDVMAHWTMLANGGVPEGFTVVED